MKTLLLAYAATALLALATGPPISELSNLTATAILGWYAWHTATRTIPRLVESFRRELATERMLHRADRDAFLLEMAEQRAQRHADHAAVIQAIENLKAAA